MRRLKSYSRSTMVEDRLNGLALLNFHLDRIPSSENVIKTFAGMKPRRLEFTLWINKYFSYFVPYFMYVYNVYNVKFPIYLRKFNFDLIFFKYPLYFSYFGSIFHVHINVYNVKFPKYLGKFNFDFFQYFS